MVSPKLMPLGVGSSQLHIYNNYIIFVMCKSNIYGKYLSANNIKIPVLSEDSKEFVRYLEDKDVDEEFIHELKHDNIKVVYIDKSLKKLTYQTKEMLYDTLLFNRNVPLKQGDLGVFDVTRKDAACFQNDGEKIAAVFGVNIGYRYIEEEKLYVKPSNQSKWKAVSAEEADVSVTITIEGEMKGTYHFKRIWP